MEVRKNFFSHREVEDWNRVPSELTRAGTVKSFKNSYADHRAKLVDMEMGKTRTRVGPHLLLTLAKRLYLGHCESTYNNNNIK